jgi:hypothetical protein
MGLDTKWKVAMSETTQCMIQGCNSAADIIIELKGQQLVLCRTHFKGLISRLSRVAERSGAAYPSRIKLVKMEDGKVKLLIRKTRSKKKKEEEEKGSKRKGKKKKGRKARSKSSKKTKK